MTKVIPLSASLICLLLASCALSSEPVEEEPDDAPVRINPDAIPKESDFAEKITKQVDQPLLSSENKLGFRTPNLVDKLPTQSQTTGSAPLPPTVDEAVEAATTIRADAE